MLDIQKCMNLFKESLSKRLERHEDNWKNLIDKIKAIEELLSEYKNRFRRLENWKN